MFEKIKSLLYGLFCGFMAMIFTSGQSVGLLFIAIFIPLIIKMNRKRIDSFCVSHVEKVAKLSNKRVLGVAAGVPAVMTLILSAMSNPSSAAFWGTIIGAPFSYMLLRMYRMSLSVVKEEN